jgi:hypothetical protein
MGADKNVSVAEGKLGTYLPSVNANRTRIFRIAGIVILVASIGLMPWKILQLNHLRAQPGYYDPTDGEQSVLANYLYILGGIGIGCVFLWVASRSKGGK